MSELHVLLTGFGPFLENKTNLTEEIVEKLNGTEIKLDEKTVKMSGIVLEVSNNGMHVVADNLRSRKWDLVLHMGLDAKANVNSIEICAWNCRADNGTNYNIYIISWRQDG
jgi:pyrrolidone-carboxylate peptidase